MTKLLCAAILGLALGINARASEVFAPASASALVGTVAIANGGTGATSGSAALTALGGVASGANSSITSLTGLTSMQFGSLGPTISSAPIFHVCGPIIVGTLATGTTFMSFTPDAAITLIRVTATIEVAGIGGAGDTVKCNNAAGTGVSVTVTAAATAGNVTSTAGSAAIAYQGAVSCHIDSAATTRPIADICLEYVMQ